LLLTEDGVLQQNCVALWSAESSPWQQSCGYSCGIAELTADPDPESC